MKVVLVMFKDGERRDFPLTLASNVIGRKSDCALRIPTGDVSRRHCELKILDDQITVRDLGSANGTYVNGKRIAESTIKAGDELGVGPVKFIMQVDGKPTDVRPPKSADESKPAADSGAITVDEEELFVLDEDDLLRDDGAISALEALADDDEEEDRRPKRK